MALSGLWLMHMSAMDASSSSSGVHTGVGGVQQQQLPAVGNSGWRHTRRTQDGPAANDTTASGGLCNGSRAAEPYSADQHCEGRLQRHNQSSARWVRVLQKAVCLLAMTGVHALSMVPRLGASVQSFMQY